MSTVHEKAKALRALAKLTADAYPDQIEVYTSSSGKNPMWATNKLDGWFMTLETALIAAANLAYGEEWDTA